MPPLARPAQRAINRPVMRVPIRMRPALPVRSKDEGPTARLERPGRLKAATVERPDRLKAARVERPDRLKEVRVEVPARPREVRAEVPVKDRQDRQAAAEAVAAPEAPRVRCAPSPVPKDLAPILPVAVEARSFT